ncbi:MAG: hypothetical protein J7K40_10115 [candidate division Zixibacteria bacterium]|nr:hypothetical protein [candidate division Zixibacteria bacterium]
MYNIYDYLDAGNHQAVWKADDFVLGVYSYRIDAGDIVETKKMQLLKQARFVGARGRTPIAKGFISAWVCLSGLCQP